MKYVVAREIKEDKEDEADEDIFINVFDSLEEVEKYLEEE
jgi:hypothetical protein